MMTFPFNIGKDVDIAHLRKAAVLLILSIVAQACNYTGTLPPPVVSVQGSTTASSSNMTASASNSTDPANTPNPISQAVPLPYANMVDVSKYFNPAGQAAQAWYGLPIMPQATAGQEFIPGQIYSFKAAATITQAVNYYKAKLPALQYSLDEAPTTGTTGSESTAAHNSILNCYKGTQILVIYIASYDKDPGHIIVVLSTQ
jgi:hypothetical protein